MPEVRRVSSSNEDVFIILEEFIPHQFSVVANRVSQSITKEFEREFGLQIPEWRILVTLFGHDFMSFHEVTAKTNMDKSRVSRAHRRLLDLELVEVTEAPFDRRKVVMKLTLRGKEVCREIMSSAREREDWLLEVLGPEEQQQLKTTMQKLFERTQELK